MNKVIGQENPGCIQWNILNGVYQFTHMLYYDNDITFVFPYFIQYFENAQEINFDI